MEKAVVHSTRAVGASALMLLVFVLTAPLTWAGASPDVPNAPTEPPRRVVDSLYESLLGVMMQADDLGYQGRFDRLAGVLPVLFDIPFMAEKSVGRYWKTANEAERQQLLATFEKFMIANYAGNFDGHSGQVFEVLGQSESTHGTVMIETRLVERDGEVVQLNYRLLPVAGRWRIIDVYLNGTVSELALRRSEYSALIKREGFAALVIALDQKISDLAEGSTPAERSP